MIDTLCNYILLQNTLVRIFGPLVLEDNIAAATQHLQPKSQKQQFIKPMAIFELLEYIVNEVFNKEKAQIVLNKV